MRTRQPSNLLVCCVLIAGSLFLARNAYAEKQETTLYSFTNGADGAYPNGHLLIDTSGNLYGTTYGDYGSGTIFEVAPNGSETTLHTFTGVNDGARPLAGLIADASGNVYGTTTQGGANYHGTVFKMTPEGSETTLYSFTGGADGDDPQGRLIMDKRGRLYGTTYQGGADGWGTVFSVSPKGREKVLYSFAGGTDGENPQTGVIMDKPGNLYGTTLEGGDTTNCSAGCGIVFQITPTGTKTILLALKGGSDSAIPNGGLILDKDGNLYGTASEGGAYGWGTVFKLTADGQETILYSFKGQSGGDGDTPVGSLVEDRKGNFYGVTLQGGATGAGTVFKLAASGAETLLHVFQAGNDGLWPTGDLILSNGYLFGTTTAGGSTGCIDSDGCGTVFMLQK